MKIPTKFAVVEVGWGEGKKHLYTATDMAEIEYFKTEDDARKGAEEYVVKDKCKMVAVLEVKALFEISTACIKVA